MRFLMPWRKPDDDHSEEVRQVSMDARHAALTELHVHARSDPYLARRLAELERELTHHG